MVVLEKTRESPLDYTINPVNLKGNQPWIFIGRTDTETPILWPPDVKSWLIGKDPDGGKDWGQSEKGAAEDEMVGWHHQLNGHEFEQAPRDGEGQGSLECAAVYQVAKSQTLLSYWTATTIYMETPISWLFSRDFIGQKGMAWENQTNKRKKSTSKRLRETSCNPWLWIGSISVNVWGVLMCVFVCVCTLFLALSI